LQQYSHSNIQVTSPSNGTLLWHHRDLLDRIQDKISFTISIDAATTQTYAQVRGGNWDDLQQGIHRYQSIIQHFCFVVQEQNWREIKQFAEYARALGRRADYQKLEDWGHWSSEWWFQNNPLDRSKPHYNDVLAMLRQTRDQYPESSFATSLVNLMNKKS
jgi:molybdenum cofactor biosynthesis enzyme MoaA